MINASILQLSSRAFVTVSALALLLASACSNNTSSPPASSPGRDDDGTVQTQRDALAFIAPCTSQACGEIPASSTSAKPECRQVDGACAWQDPDPNASVSYRECEASACGAKPDASVCPSGTTFKGAQCGSENEGACIWRSACVAPPSTVACPDVDGCGGKPEIGVICKDGSTGDLLCMKQGAKCGWERSCE